MNPFYSIMESPHRWWTLAGLSFGAACIGAIVMLNYGWSHLLCQLWFYAGAVLTLVFLARGVLKYVKDLTEPEQQGHPFH